METGPAEIRDAASADVDDLCRLLGILFAQEREFRPDVHRQRRGLERILDDPAVGTVLVAVWNGRIVGMATLLYTVSTALGAPVASLEDMVIEPMARSSGIGRAVVEAAIRRCRAAGCQRITLLTDADNHRAHRFYEGAGFTRSAMVAFRQSLSET